MTIVPLFPDWAAIAAKRSEEDSQKAVDALIKKNHNPMYVNFIAPCYYVRTSRLVIAPGFPLPTLVVQKDKLRSDQIEFMERKCEETNAERK